MKNAVKYFLHKLFGFRNYLFLFSLYKIRTLRNDRKEGDFFLFLDLLPPDTLVLDIGANIGIMTAHLARSGKNLSVYAFEPMPNNIEALQRIIKWFSLGSRVTLFPIALGNTEGEVQMVMPVVGSVRMQGLSHVVHESITEFNEGIKVAVPLKTLDAMPEILNASRPISGIKIDIENFEYFALDGGKQMIARHKPIIYAELWDNDNRKNCFTLLTGMGYTIKVSDKGKLMHYNPAIHIKQNFIFTP
jgi:FkbM family methyltransferase